MRLLLLTCLVTLGWAQSGEVVLTPALQTWRQEIEQLDRSTVILARVYTDQRTNTLDLPGDTPHRNVVAQFLQQENIVRVLVLAHAMNVNYNGIFGRYRIALLNMALAEQWRGQEEAVIAHEFAHMWLMAQSYPYSPIGSRRDVCEQSAANDIVQHILMRRELAARKIAYNPYWVRSLTISLQQLEKPSANQPSRCQRMAALATWLDVELGLTSAIWPERDRLLTSLAEHYPTIKPIALDLANYLRDHDVADKVTYAAALRYALRKVEEVPSAIQ